MNRIGPPHHHCNAADRRVVGHLAGVWGRLGIERMCNLYSITTNQAAIIGLFRVINHYVGNLPPMAGVFPDYPAPVIRNAGDEREMALMRWGMPPPPRTGGPPVTRNRKIAPHRARAMG